MLGKTNTNFQNLIQTYDNLTAEISNEKAMDMMCTDQLDHFLLLLKIADNIPMGKSKSILYAFKLGYLEGQKQNQ